ncbi:glycoside hydrolase family 172 protein [Sphingobacterium cellulitidis]|uniref:glycoside hydrolase family 172 protein n=1 Tax=Sphingobacterium cellulitidis TaxID=1768011 RepID=UPI003C7BA532
MKRVFLNFLVLCSIGILNVGLSYSQKADYSFIAELDNLIRPDLLPSYRPFEYVEQISSYDRTGKNDDGFGGAYSFIRKEGNNLVIADFKGPGVVNRIWTPTPTDDTLAFYFDGEKKARLRIRFSDLFSGKVFPFVRGISGNEVGGYYSYLPISYQKSLKIVFEGEKILFLQIQNRSLPNSKVNSYTGKFSDLEKSKIEEVGRVYSENNPSIALFEKGKSKGIKAIEKSIVIQPGEEIEFFETDKAGRIVGFEIDAGTSFEGYLKDIILSAKWDGEEIEGIYAPIADYFGYAYGKKAMRSLFMGSKGNLNYSYIPMPFDQKAEMSLVYKKRANESQSPISIKTKVYYSDNARDKDREGKYYAVWRREKPETGQYYEFLKTSGKGHYIGTIHMAQGLRAGMTLFFEGDDVTHVDGKQRLHGTGSEDYYNGGWYALLDRWDRGISLPIHGSLDYSLPMGRTGAYRFFMTDKMPFEKEIDHVIEHGPEGNEFPVDYTSIAMYYAAQPLKRKMEPSEELRTVYLPNEHEYFPQLMEVTLGGGAEVKHDRGLRMRTDGHHTVRVMLTDVPEGEYKLSISYFEKENGAEFAIWQRQKMVSDWKSSQAAQEKLNYKIEMGTLKITKQTNSITFHVRKLGEKGNEFELDRIFLEKIGDL